MFLTTEIDGVDLGAATPIAGQPTSWQTDASGLVAWIRLPAGGATSVVVK